MFSYYNQEGPLVAFIFPDGQKYQGHAPSNQFMDSTDNPVPFTVVAAPWSDLIATTLPGLWLAMSLLESDRWDDSDVRTATLRDRNARVPAWATAEHCEDALVRFGLSLRAIPPDLVTPRAAQEAVFRLPTMIANVPERLIDPEMALRVLTMDGTLLRFIPQALRTPDLCQAAVRQNGTALRDVPDEAIDVDLCRLASLREMYGNGFMHVPPRFLDQIAPEAVGHLGTLLAYVPENRRTAELCEIAMSNAVMAFDSVPQPLLTRGMLMKAFRAGLNIVGWTDTQLARAGVLNDPTLIRAAVRGCAANLAKIPEHLRTRDLCRIALSTLQGSEPRDFSLLSIPDHLWDVDLLRLAVRTRPERLPLIRKRKPDLDIPDDVVRLAVFRQPSLALKMRNLMTRETWTIAVRGEGNLIAEMPKRWRSNGLMLAAARSSAQALAILAKEKPHLVTEDLMEASIRGVLPNSDIIAPWLHSPRIKDAILAKAPMAIFLFPAEHIDKVACIAALSGSDDPHLLDRLLIKAPAGTIDADVCMAAVARRGERLGRVPKEFLDRALCLRAVTTWGGALEHVPPELVDRDLCLAAVRTQGWAIRLVPWSLRDSAMARAALASPMAAENARNRLEIFQALSLDVRKEIEAAGNPIGRAAG